MKAIRVDQFGGPEVLTLAEAPIPDPCPGQLVVRVKAAGVNPVDAYIRSGTYARRPALPYTPGSDAAGTVEMVGKGVEAFKPGDRVYTSGSISGAYAEFALCDVSHAHPLPDGTTFNQGAALGVPYATAYRALMHRAATLPSETVLVHGASGGVGTASVQLASAHGMRVFGTAGTVRGQQLVREQGACEVFDHRAPDYCHRIIETSGGRGVDVILEMLASANLGKDLSLLAPGGRVIVIGSRGKVEIDPRDAMSREADIRGMLLFNTPPDELASIHAALFAGLERGALRPVIALELPLAKAHDAHAALSQPGTLGKIVLVP